jgi:site-specific DNA-cytosine methylase
MTNAFSSAHFFAGCGGDICGLKMAGWSPAFAVEMNRYRCQTLRANHPTLKVFEGPIQQLTLDDYPRQPISLFFLTFPCDHYTLAANVHQKWTGDSLYLEALREIVLQYPEMVVVENVWGFRKFKRAIETFRSLPLYYCTEFGLEGANFTHQRKKRVFLILHRQPYNFPALERYQLPRPGSRLRDYLEMDAPLPPIPPYIYTRLDGGTYRDGAKVYDPDQEEPVHLFANYGRDRSLFLVRDPRAPRGVRPFTVREVANLHGFPRQPIPYQFIGGLNETYDMVIDSVMPPVAEALGRALTDYLAAIPRLAQTPKPLGYRQVLSSRQKQEELDEALRIVREEPINPHTTHQLVLWGGHA